MAKQLELADDGRVIIRNRADEWVLERPTLGELRKLVEMAEATDQKLRDAVAAVPEDHPNRLDEQTRISSDLQLGPDSVYGGLVREFVAMLSDKEPPDLDDLPGWAVSGRAAGRMIAHWRSVPLDLSGDDPAQ